MGLIKIHSISKLKKVVSIRNCCVYVFFLSFLLLGTKIYTHYGVSVDEGLERANGMVSLVYAGNYLHIPSIQNDPYIASYREVRLEEWWARHYPVGFTVPAILLEKFFHLQDEQQVFYFRHLLTFLVCFLGVISVFKIAERRFDDWRIGLLAATFLILSPRFFAESFYNSKDLVLMSWFAIVLNSMVAFVLKPTWSRLFFHAFTSAMAIDIRLMAIVFPLATSSLIALRVVRRKLLLARAIAMTLIYIAFIVIFVVMTWPYLWADPWGRFIEALAYMVKLNFPVQSLYMGNIYASNQLPWHYLPVWIGISTPPLYILLFLVGTFFTIKEVLGQKWKSFASDQLIQDGIFFVFFWAPVAAIMIRGSTLYDSWRHAYFIYPAFLLLAVKGFVVLKGLKIGRRSYGAVIATVAFTCLLTTGWWMKQNHPYQNVYFNFLAGHHWKDRFDLDYWGLANRQALEYILDHDPRQVIKVQALNPVLMPLEMAKTVITPSQKTRIQVLEDVSQRQQADYVITNYRLDSSTPSGDAFELIHEIVVDKEVIVSVFRRKT